MEPIAGTEKTPQVNRHRLVSSRAYGYLYILPGLLIAGGLIIYPIIFGVYVSFHQWDWAKGQAAQMVFIGLGNYARLFRDTFFWEALQNTLIFTFVALVLELILGLICALLLFNISKGSVFFRTALIFPLMISDIVAAIMWKMLLDPSRGHINYFLSLVGVPTIEWLTNPDLVIFTIAFVDTWWQTGLVTIIMLAGLQSLNPEPREMALVDGASNWQVFRHITLPELRPFIWTVVIFRTIDLLRVFAIVWGTTGGGPVRASQVTQLYIYLQGMGSYLNIGYSSSLAVTFAVIIGVLITIFTRYALKEEER